MPCIASPGKLPATSSLTGWRSLSLRATRLKRGEPAPRPEAGPPVVLDGGRLCRLDVIRTSREGGRCPSSSLSARAQISLLTVARRAVR
jgi:hypothetical protein